jgi:hypothetical protein
MSDIFISYAREDEAKVGKLASELVRLGWSVWYDRSLVASEEYDERIEKELDTAACVIVVWSRASIRSRYVRAEAGAADDQGKLIPIAFDFDVVPPMRFRQLNIAKLSSTSLESPTDASLSLLRELSAATGKSPQGLGDRGTSGGRSGGRSGARTVTPGKWTVTTRFLFAKATYDLDLLSSGMVTGTGGWTVSRARMSGRWHYDVSSQLVQLEMSGGISEGLESIAIQVLSWEDDDTAKCTFHGGNQSRSAQLKRRRA